MSYQHLTAKERRSIMYCHQYGLSLREIARRLGRSHSTISRELRRNQRVCGTYWDEAAEKFAAARRKVPRHQRRWANSELRDYVFLKLAWFWSPEEISGRLKQDFPNRRSMRISPEGIYQWVFKDTLAGGEWYRCLRRIRRYRRRQGRLAYVGRSIKNRVDISERPGIVDTRRRVGDWEGDTIMGRLKTGHIATYVERKTGYLVACKLSDKRALPLSKESSKALLSLPKAYRQTLTLDNGSEFSRHQELAETTGMTVYFARPHSPWQRGCNENMNGLLRQYFPKGHDFRTITQQDLAEVVESVNNRPRKRFKYRTPSEMLIAAGGALRT